jgi:hypothetical protein
MTPLKKPYSQYIGKWLHNNHNDHCFFLVRRVIVKKYEHSTTFHGFTISADGNILYRELVYNNEMNYPEKIVKPTKKQKMLVIRYIFEKITT